MLAIALVALREPLAGYLWPDPRVQVLLEQAEAALRNGQLNRADGQGARQLFEAAQALDGDRSEARSGLGRVAAAALRQSQQALAAGDLAEARAQLQLARDLQSPRPQADQVEQALRRQEAALAGVDDLLRQAQLAHQQGRLEGDDQSALPLYQRVLALQPSRIEALEGREDALADLLQLAHLALRQGQLAGTAAMLERARQYDKGHADLPSLQSDLTEAIARRIRQADRDLQRGRIDAAITAYQSVLAADPAHEAALRGQERVAAAHAQRATRAAADFDFAKADRALEQARELSPQSAAVAEAQRHIEVSRQSQRRSTAILPVAERQRRVDSALAALQQAASRGEWITPPGESAYDHLRRAQSLAPDDPQVRQAAQRLQAAVQRCFEEELHGNRLRRSQSCLQAWQTLQPGHAQLADARRRMAQKWIAVGDERLGAGDVAFALQALQEAQRLDRRAPGVEDFSGRVRSARPGVD